MPSLQTMLLFMGTSLALNLAPGPAILFILSRCLAQGRTAAIVSVFGLATSSIIHAVAAALGLSTIFAYSPLAFDLIKYCGAAYLIYLGISGFARDGIGGLIAGAERRQSTLAMVYWQGMLTDLLNPKLLLFFFSFLSQFIDPTRGEPRMQMLFFTLITAIFVGLKVLISGEIPDIPPGFLLLMGISNGVYLTAKFIPD